MDAMQYKTFWIKKKKRSGKCITVTSTMREREKKKIFQYKNIAY